MDQTDFEIFAIEFAMDDMKHRAIECRKKGQPFYAFVSWDGKEIKNDIKLTRKDGREA